MVKSFPDTSFLFSVYREQLHSPKADAYMEAWSGPLPVSSLLILELRQSIRLHGRLYSLDKRKGFSKEDGKAMLRDLQSDFAAGILEIVPVNWAEVHQIAERLSANHTEQRGHRLADILHVATALHLGAQEFLTFDANQKGLAEAEGLLVKV